MSLEQITEANNLLTKYDLKFRYSCQSGLAALRTSTLLRRRPQRERRPSDTAPL